MTGHRKSFLITTWEGGGSVSPALELARRLVGRGHLVRVMSDACNRPETEAAGARFVPWTRAPSRKGRGPEHNTFNTSPVTPQEDFYNFLHNIFVGPAHAYAQDLIEELRREPADLVVASDILFGVPLACEAIGQKHVILGVNINMFPHPAFIPVGASLRPPGTEEERRLHDDVRALSQAFLDTALPALNAGRAAYGLRPLAHITEQHDAAERILLATSAAFDFAPEAMPERYAYVGPLIGEPAWAEDWATPFAADDARPLALVSFSTTFQHHTEVLQRVVDAIGSLPMRGVVTLGGSVAPDAIRAPRNVVVRESAPHGAILREAALAVTHGGHGTVMKALVAGKPMLILPHGRDQDDNAVRVVDRGAGLVLPPSSDTAAIRAALVQLIGSLRFAEAAAQLGAKVRTDVATSPLLGILEGAAGGCVCSAAA